MNTSRLCLSTNGRNLLPQRGRFLATTRNDMKKNFSYWPTLRTAVYKVFWESVSHWINNHQPRVGGFASYTESADTGQLGRDRRKDVKCKPQKLMLPAELQPNEVASHRHRGNKYDATNDQTFRAEQFFGGLRPKFQFFFSSPLHLLTPIPLVICNKHVLDVCHPTLRPDIAFCCCSNLYSLPAEIPNEIASKQHRWDHEGQADHPTLYARLLFMRWRFRLRLYRPLPFPFQLRFVCTHKPSVDGMALTLHAWRTVNGGRNPAQKTGLIIKKHLACNDQMLNIMVLRAGFEPSAPGLRIHIILLFNIMI